MKKLILTGARGFLGTHLLRFLRNSHEEYSIDIIDRKGINFEQYSYISWKEINKIDFNDSTIIHLANSKEARDNDEMIEILDKKIQQSSVERIVLMSSVSVYGNFNGSITVETDEKPSNDYAKSKLYAEQLVKATNDYDTKNTIIRSSAIVGSGMPPTFLRRAYESVNKGEKVKVRSKSSLFNNCMHVDSMVRLIDHEIKSDEQCSTYVTGSTNPIDLATAMEILKQDNKSIERLIEECSEIDSFYIDEELIHKLPKCSIQTTEYHLQKMKRNLNKEG